MFEFFRFMLLGLPINKGNLQENQETDDGTSDSGNESWHGIVNTKVNTKITNCALLKN